MFWKPSVFSRLQNMTADSLNCNVLIHLACSLAAKIYICSTQLNKITMKATKTKQNSLLYVSIPHLLMDFFAYKKQRNKNSFGGAN